MKILAICVSGADLEPIPCQIVQAEVDADLWIDAFAKIVHDPSGVLQIPTNNLISMFGHADAFGRRQAFNQLADAVWEHFDVQRKRELGFRLAGSVVLAGPLDADGTPGDISPHVERWVMQTVHMLGAYKL